MIAGVDSFTSMGPASIDNNTPTSCEKTVSYATHPTPIAPVERAHTITSLGKRPDAVCHLNGGSFNQDAITTYNGYQFAAVYLDASPGLRRVNVFRRELPEGKWSGFAFDDYDQVLDDGHNVVCMGISPVDGRMHLAWDLHNSTFNYRASHTDVSGAMWGPGIFGSVEHRLPGVPEGRLEMTTYPRFVRIPRQFGGALLLELRTGIAGLGDCWLFAYGVNGVQQWREIGVYLKGVDNNPYINGIDLAADGSLHVTWCYRDYVAVTLDQTRQHAGPNGPENNHDLMYAWSPFDPERGVTGVQWFDREGKRAGSTPGGVLPSAGGAKVFDLPKGSGVINQESQSVSPEGVVALNREDIHGVSTWFLYSIPKSGAPSKRPLPFRPASSTSARGKLVQHSNRHLAILSTENDIVILDLAVDKEIARVRGAGGHAGQEVLFDRHRDDVLSLFVEIGGELCVVDVDLS